MSDLHARALALFDAYLELSATDRERALSALAQRDPALSAAVRSLFDADRDSDGGVLDLSPADLIAAKSAHGARDDEGRDLRIGAHLGPWRIDRRIAAGGMGDVYEAHRDDGEYVQRVALKCIRAELATTALLAAFRRERNLLARLDHPGIAAIVDGGVDDAGRPWFAMRLVEGDLIDAWCDGRRATVRARVDLLIQACDALAYAHAQGVVHGDIKPSNLLVKADGQVQLIDFGIASLFGAHDPRIAVTTDYAAPETLDHGAMGPPTDIYAFGVLMYRLLCAQWPAPAHGWRALMPQMPDGEILPMDRMLAQASATVAEQRGALDVPALRRALAGDLSAIASKAIAVRPEDRYASAGELAAELRRWREHRPLVARPGGWTLRARKWLRRNRLGAGLTGLLLVALGAGVGVSLWQRQHALRETQATAAVGQLFASTLGTATLSGLGTTPFSSRALLEKTERDMRAMHLETHPALLARSLAMLARSWAVIGDYRKADLLADEAQRVLRSTRENDGYVVATRLSILNIRARFPQAAALAQAGIAALGDRDDDDAVRARTIFQTELAQAQWGKAELQQARRTLGQALAAADSLHDPELIAQLLIVRSGFDLSLGNLASAEADARRAIALTTTRNPILADDAREQLLTALSRRSSTDQLALARQLLRDRRATLGERHPKTARAWIRLSDALPPKESEQALRKGLVLIEATYGRDHPEYATAASLAAWALQIPPNEKIAMMRTAVGVLERTLGADSEPLLTTKAGFANLLLDQLRDEHEPQRAEEGFALLEAAIRGKRARGFSVAWDELFLAHDIVIQGRAERLPQAAALLRSAAADQRMNVAAGDLYPLELAQFQDKLLYRQGQRAQADRNFARRIEANRAFLAAPWVGRDSNDYGRGVTLHESLMYRAFYAYENCDVPRARTYLEQALAFDLRAYGADSVMSQTAKIYLSNLRTRTPLRAVMNSVLISTDEIAAVNRRAAACRTRS
jgi:hypothetical protein